MPLFRFHFRQGLELVLDRDGLDCRDLGAAKHEAIRGARSIFSAQVLEGKLCLDESIDVHDASGELVWTVTFGNAVEITHSTPANRGRLLNQAA
ncbi:MAG TPA: hypothetical protein VEZ41_02130, partial [Allosphingosinicella sp.]|jgi:hypothetical protein|nr:hypothetical protein [Allosphingosinicella sp.]